MNKNTASGFTLIEVLVTIGIGAILAVSAGTILVHMNIHFLRGKGDIQIVSDSRYAKLRIEKELRTARSFTSFSNNDITFTNTGGVVINIQEDDPNDEIELTKGGTTEIILFGATNLRFTKITDWRGFLTGVDVEIDYQRQVRPSFFAVDYSSFTVQLRSVAKGVQ
jgi:prepilin-type N-terminal cleavage/methylation domain-containing protein